MDPVMISRRIAKREYAAVRRPFAFLDDRLLGRYWNQDAVVRSGYGRLLGSMDRFAGWLLADDAIARRGRDLQQRTGPATDAWEQAAEEPIARKPAAEVADTPAEPAAPAVARTVDVTFSLPGEVGAGNVALCGDFNGWSADNIALQRGGDGAWQVTLPLEPGQSYRFRYLLDGERWENAWQADWYEPNPFGSDNSVVSVGGPERTLDLAA
jgi:hypothetical protein